MTDIELIKDKIANMPNDEIFIISDFEDITNYENIRKVLSRIKDEKQIRLLLPGIYYKPSYSKILQEYSSPNIDKVARAIARKNNWTITPCGDTALNQLGLSTQVPAKWKYISSGPNKEYIINHTAMSFVHRSNKETLGMSPKTSLIIQAIKAIGKENINQIIIENISNKLTSSEKQNLLEESKSTVNWIRQIIRRL